MIDLSRWFTATRDKRRSTHPWHEWITPVCCDEAIRQSGDYTGLVFYPHGKDDVLSWAIECVDGNSGFDVLYCPWCGAKLPTADELRRQGEE